MLRTALISCFLVCAVVPAGAVDWTSSDTLSDAQGLLERESWPAAVAMLKRIVAERPEDPDAINLLAFALRKTGAYDRAEGFYLKALSLDPQHIGATAYLGELYVETGRLAEAEQQLNLLADYCPMPCSAADDLRTVIEAAR